MRRFALSELKGQNNKWILQIFFKYFLYFNIIRTFEAKRKTTLWKET